jgi:hypothetical protein
VHIRIFADAGAIALTLGRVSTEEGPVDLAHASKKKKKKRKKRCTPAKRRPVKRAKGASAEATTAARKKHRRKKRPVCRKKKRPRPHGGTHPAAPGPATPPVPGPAAPVPPPPPAPLLSTIQSPIAVYGGSFGARQAERLLWRAGFGPRPGQAQALAALGMEKAVLSLTRPSGTAPMDGPAPTDDGAPLAPYDHYDHDLLFWLDRMVRSRHQLVERLALVFHDWFATSNDAVGSNRLMLDQTNVFRANGLGNFATLVNKITQNPAMILFLDLASNRKGEPNENYARELMELFTLGADRGAYTEEDVRELGRSLTGWDYDWSDELGVHNFHWDEQDRWDPTYKTVFGQRGRWTWADAARMVVEHDKHPSFFVAKLWSYFIPTPPDADTAGKLEALYKGSGYEIRPVLEAILCSPQLYDGPRMVKPPTVFVAGCCAPASGESPTTSGAGCSRAPASASTTRRTSRAGTTSAGSTRTPRSGAGRPSTTRSTTTPWIPTGARPTPPRRPRPQWQRPARSGATPT